MSGVSSRSVMRTATSFMHSARAERERRSIWLFQLDLKGFKWKTRAAQQPSTDLKGYIEPSAASAAFYIAHPYRKRKPELTPARCST